MASAQLQSNIPIVDNKVGLRIYSEHSFTKPILWLNGTADDFTTEPTARNLSGSFNYKYSKTGKLKLFGLYTTDKQGVKIDRAEFDGYFTGDSENSFFNLRHSDLLWNSLLVKNSLSFNKYWNKWRLGLLDLTKTDRVLKFRSDFELGASKNRNLLFGFEYENRIEIFKGTIPNEEFDYRPNSNGDKLKTSIITHHLGVYGEAQVKNFLRINNIFIIPGIRFDNFAQFNINWIDPRLAIGYKLSENSELKLSGGIFHQLPQTRLLSDSEGNPNLEPMKAAHIILSYDKEFSMKSSFRIETYFKDYDNLPLENQSTNYRSKGFGRAYGLDVILKGNLPFDIEGWLSYGYIDTKRKWMDYTRLSKSSYDITHSFSLVAKYYITSMWQIGLNYKYSTGRPYTPIIDAEYHKAVDIFEPVYGSKNSQRYPDYNRLDVRLTHLNQLFGKFVVFYIEGLNILNIKNIFGYSHNYDYSERKKIESYFGRRTIVFGGQIEF